MFFVNQTLPVCNIPLDYDDEMDKCNYIEETKIEDIFNGFVGSDCWAIQVKYSCHNEPIVEMNSYHLFFTKS
jgi:hypothetical protein